MFLLLLTVAVQVPAQQREADARLLADIRAKAEKGDAQSQLLLGRAFALGNLGLATNYVEAVKWLRKAAEQNDATAQFNLGVCYDKGQGVAKDEAEAVKWYRKAAEQNDAKAQHNLGFCYAKGQGVAKDEVEAVKWYRKAAEQNDAKAQCNLGFCYDTGRGVAKDEVEGYKWFLLAAGQGDETARENMAVSERRLTREQIAEGQKLARNFKPRSVPSARSDISGTGILETRPESSGTGFFITDVG
jgi:TPR repeat protein